MPKQIKNAPFWYTIRSITLLPVWWGISYSLAPSYSWNGERLLLYIDDDDDDVYLHRIHPQHKLENYAPYVKYRPAKKA
jgi:hypothetical protein